MKKNNKIVICLAATALLAGTITGAFAASKTYTPGAGIDDSPHNINRVAPGGDTYNRTCAYCHTPHHANSDAAELQYYNPLWSHEVSTGTYAGYVSSTFDTTHEAVNSDILIGPSRLCMSCHDGVIAVDQHYGGAIKNVVKNGGDTWGQIDVADGVNKSLANDHPIGFKYNLISADNPGADADTAGGVMYNIRKMATEFTVDLSGGSHYDPSTKLQVFNVAGDGLMLSNPAAVKRTIKDLMWQKTAGATDYYMTCASCHDVHNKENPEQYLLVNMEANSEICLTCHNK